MPLRHAIALGAVLSIGIVHLVHFRFAAVDDAFISFRYGQNLARGHGLVFNPDAPAVEGYSNFLWTVLIAPWAARGEPLAAARVVGVVLLAVVWLLVAWQVRRRAAPAAALLLLAASPAMAYWALAGLEPVLVAAFVLAALAATERATRPTAQPRTAWLAAAAWLGVVLARADGIALAGVAAAVYAVHAWRARQLAAFARVWVPVAAGWIGYTVWRLATYGDFIPNAARAKLTGTGPHLAAGFTYLGAVLVAHPWLVLVPFAVRVLRRSGAAWRPGVDAAAALIATQCAIAVAAGGDWMPLHRWIVPVLPVAAALAGAAFASRVPAAFAAVALVAPVAYWTSHAPFAVLLHRENVAVGTALGRALAAETAAAPSAHTPVLAIAAAGAAPFYSGLPAIDLSGLCDRHIARVVPAGPVPGLPVGHLKGDGAEVMRRRPDLLAFVLGRNERPGVDAAEVQLLFEPAFHAEYTRWELTAPRTPSRVRLWRATPAQLRQLEFLAGLRPVPGAESPGALLTAPTSLRFVVFRRLDPEAAAAAAADIQLRRVSAAVDTAMQAQDFARARELLMRDAAAFDSAGIPAVREVIAARCAAAAGNGSAARAHLQQAYASARGIESHVRLVTLLDPLLRPLIMPN